MSWNLQETVRAVMLTLSLMLLVAVTENAKQQTAGPPVVWSKSWKVSVDPDNSPVEHVPSYRVRRQKTDQSRLLLAQSKYALLFIPQVEFCKNLVIKAKIKDEDHEGWEDKRCMKSTFPSLFWTFDFKPDLKYDLRVTLFDENDAKNEVTQNPTVLLDTEVHSLPEKPPPLHPDLSTNVGPGWIEIIFRVPQERSPNLLGYSVMYEVPILEYHNEYSSRFNEKISDFEHVDYSLDLPSVMPVHPCPWWNVGEYFCIVISDFVRPDYYLKQMKNIIRIKTFRILPIGEKQFSDEHVVDVSQRMCDLQKEGDCPSFALFPDKPSRPQWQLQGGQEPVANWTGDIVEETKQDALLSDYHDSEMGLNNPTWKTLKKKDDKTFKRKALSSMKFWGVIIALAFLVIFMLIPLVYIVGRRNGARTARHKWLRLVSSSKRTTLSFCGLCETSLRVKQKFTYTSNFLFLSLFISVSFLFSFLIPTAFLPLHTWSHIRLSTYLDKELPIEPGLKSFPMRHFL